MLSLFFLVRLEPVLAPSAVGDEGNAEGISVLHLLDNDALYELFLLGNDREIEFVVHLKYHL